MSIPYDLKCRTRDFALQVINLFRKLPRGAEAEVIGKQILRSGTSVGAHYREAVRARSVTEYASKLTGGLMELEETAYWLELIKGAKLQSEEVVTTLSRETHELTAIFVSLIKKAKRPTGP